MKINKRIRGEEEEVFSHSCSSGYFCLLEDFFLESGDRLLFRFEPFAEEGDKGALLFVFDSFWPLPAFPLEFVVVVVFFFFASFSGERRQQYRVTPMAMSRRRRPRMTMMAIMAGLLPVPSVGAEVF